MNRVPLLLFHVQMQLEDGWDEDEKGEKDTEACFHLAATVKVGKTHVLDAWDGTCENKYREVVNAVDNDARHNAVGTNEYPAEQQSEQEGMWHLCGIHVCNAEE